MASQPGLTSTLPSVLKACWCSHGGDARGDLVFRAGEKHRHEAAHHQVVHLLLGLAQAAGRLQGGDDGKVIADLGVVEHPLGGADVVVVQCGQLRAAPGGACRCRPASRRSF